MTDSLAGIAGHSTPGPVSPGFERGEKLRAQLVRATKKRPGRRPDLIREFVCKGPPAFHEDDRWDYDQLCDRAYNVYDYFHAAHVGRPLVFVRPDLPEAPSRREQLFDLGRVRAGVDEVAGVAVVDGVPVRVLPVRVHRFRMAHSPC